MCPCIGLSLESTTVKELKMISKSLTLLPEWIAPSSWWQHVPLAHWLICERLRAALQRVSEQCSALAALLSSARASARCWCHDRVDRDIDLDVGPHAAVDGGPAATSSCLFKCHRRRRAAMQVLPHQAWDRRWLQSAAVVAGTKVHDSPDLAIGERDSRWALRATGCWC